MENNKLIPILAIVGLVIIGGLYWTNRDETSNPSEGMKGEDTSTVDNDVPTPIPNEEMVYTDAIVDESTDDGSTIYQQLKANPNLTTAIAAINAAGLNTTLDSDGEFTVFAPTNEAFAKVPAATISDWLKPENRSQLTNVLNYHVVKGVYKADDLKDGQTLMTVSGKLIKITKSNDQIKINGSTMADGNMVETENGILYTIDTMLMIMSN